MQEQLTIYIKLSIFIDETCNILFLGTYTTLKIYQKQETDSAQIVKSSVNYKHKNETLHEFETIRCSFICPDFT